ncbi:cyclase family protein [Tenacibaculum sp. AHE15PA]|uniref:cyclase family protein n=1 Tax=unclassified Tenacibaculum TaxID=2635139 RepID=UPI001C4E50EB|nr:MULTISPECIES: cyclase family protein [unclassified Tenacibaculum]QXP72673.1 cyclase family protein [Tenacibaculum sp. AHE14PA]QXP76588.1 cyclase family protein [Tenacibaculum sp. AHE15PA]
MIAEITYNSEKHRIDLSKPLDISISIDVLKENINAWYVGEPEIKPVKEGNWVGSVSKGADVNFNNISFNPHAHITHTECVGHITKQVHSVNKNLNKFFFLAEVITITPKELEHGDSVITKGQLHAILKNKVREAVVIRTLPNSDKKTSTRYSNTNPPYLLEAAAAYLKEIGVKHLLIDLPSVDKEKDEGKLLAHNAFWNTANEIRFDATITEFIYVKESIKDGAYFLNLMIAPFENDATPSKPILYKIQ